jgi:hypothetical protein
VRAHVPRAFEIPPSRPPTAAAHVCLIHAYPLAVAALRTMFIGDQFRLMSPQKTGGLTLMHGKKCTPLHAPLVSVEDRVTVDCV